MTTKTFDSVKLMRDLRDELSRELEHKTPEERIRHIRERAASSELGKMLIDREDATRKRGSSGVPSSDPR